MSVRKKRSVNDTPDKSVKRHRITSKGVNFYIPLHKLNLNDANNIDKNINKNDETSTVTAEKIYTQTEVTELLNKQQKDFRSLLEEKLQEQFVMFNQFYINNIFKEYEKNDFSYIG